MNDAPAWTPEREAAVQHWLDGEPGYDGLTRDIQAALAELAARAAKIEALEAHCAWLIEAPGGNYLGVRKAIGDAYRGEFYWTADANKALRFFNEEQADLSLTAIRVLRPDLWGFAGTLGEAWPREHKWLASTPPAVSPDWPKTDATVHLVVRLCGALAAKLARSEAKYGYTDGWARDDWQDECVANLAEHVRKGDPLDVAAYAAFCWHHGWSTSPPPVAAEVDALVEEAREYASYLRGERGPNAMPPRPGNGVNDLLDRLAAALSAQPVRRSEEEIARVISPWSFDPSLEELHGPCFRGAGPWPEGQFYVWDDRHSSIFNPDGEPDTGQGPYPWRQLSSLAEAQEAADALNARRFAHVRAYRDDALDKARTLLALIYGEKTDAS